MTEILLYRLYCRNEIKVSLHHIGFSTDINRFQNAQTKPRKMPQPLSSFREAETLSLCSSFPNFPLCLTFPLQPYNSSALCPPNYSMPHFLHILVVQPPFQQILIWLFFWGLSNSSLYDSIKLSTA